MTFHCPNEFRAALPGLPAGDASNGAFSVPFEGRALFVIASDGGGWEHVSVSLRNRPPTWREMCHIKGLFWDAEDCVLQYHPPKSEYVNNHPNCLHLWRPIGQAVPVPPSIMVGIKGLEVPA